MSHRYNYRTGSGETKVESHASSETQPNQTALLLNTARIQPGSEPHQCVRGNTVHLATWLACTAPGPPRESLVCDETRISLPAKPSLTRTPRRPTVVSSWLDVLRWWTILDTHRKLLSMKTPGVLQFLTQTGAPDTHYHTLFKGT